MQNEPEKTVANFNEVIGMHPGSRHGTVESRIENLDTFEQQEVVRTGIRLVNSKVDEILGHGNHLTGENLVLPEIRFVDSLPSHPTWLGYFSQAKNLIAIITGKVKDPLTQTKVFIHEYIHFLSHNGSDDQEQITPDSPLSQNNNLGFRRNLGLDIRKGNEGKTTNDYFVSFNEAVTEQLAIDILPGVAETYSEYRGLLNQVIDDAVTIKLGSDDKNGVFQPWTRQEVKDFIYECFFKGDLSRFTQLLQDVYRDYGITEQQFGLMTSRDDLPSIIESKWFIDNPDGPAPAPGQIANMVQMRLDQKTSEDYQTDTIIPDFSGDGSDSNIHQQTYDQHLIDNKIIYSSREVIAGEVYDIDSQGFIIYHGQKSLELLDDVKKELDQMIDFAERGEISAHQITDWIDHLLFEKNRISMLSDGFSEFFVYKHDRLARLPVATS